MLSHTLKVLLQSLKRYTNSHSQQAGKGQYDNYRIDTKRQTDKARQM